MYGNLMRKFLPIMILLALCLESAPAIAAATHAFQAGKLIDVTTDERFYEGTSQRHAIFIVQIGDIIYTLRGGHVSARAKDYAQGLIIGDPVQASVEGDNVLLLKPDGKNLKTSILKRERSKLN